MEKHLTSAAAARILDVTPATVRHMARRGLLRPVGATTSGIRLFTLRDVRALARKRRQEQKGRRHG